MRSSPLCIENQTAPRRHSTWFGSAWRRLSRTWDAIGIRRRTPRRVADTLPEALELRVLPASVTLQPLKDNTLFEDSRGSLSNGAGVSIYVGVTGNAPDVRRGLLAFDIEKSVPAGSTINSVSVSLHVSKSAPGSGAQTVTLNPLLADWGEGKSDADGPNSTAPGGSGAAATTGDATWLDRFFGSKPASTWATAGGDFVTAPSASASVNGVGTVTWTSATLKSDVQKWLDDSPSNFGWLVRNTNETATQSARRFDSRESSTAANRPQLTIDFTAPVSGTTVTVDAAVAPSNVLENAGANLVYTLTRSGAVTNPLTVNFNVGGTAKLTEDYSATGAAKFTLTSGTVTFAAGSATATVTVSPAADILSEPDETVLLTVTNGTGYVAGASAAATGTIQNDDVQTGPTLVPGDTPVTFKKKSKPIVLLPNVQVRGSTANATDGLGGGQIVITMNAATNAATKPKSFDKIALPKLSAVGKLVSRKVSVGQLVIQIQLKPATNAAKLQSFLRGITFTTTGVGLNQATRNVQVQVRDAAGAVGSVDQLVNVLG